MPRSPLSLRFTICRLSRGQPTDCLGDVGPVRANITCQVGSTPQIQFSPTKFSPEESLVGLNNVNGIQSDSVAPK